ncbi:membrane protein required for colicin V production [Zhouia amylolytica]|uniref:Membrane protein required for colicin V production n=1 Tax=Zhouia amylolytica TaxID=376730 RepID=A0A1I6SEX7_9FLAO|nr:CvpA family protein [Zhouia amylolytica]MCQ0110873.1 CvpA family protein [Zhouia amylolytica]SFS75483.1 membrane protein required for colicin V production [Zhouia amylolytica]
MNFIDIVLGGLILFGFVRGLIKGLFIEVASLVALILGIYGAIHFSYFAGDFLNEKLEWDKNHINLIAFAVTFVAIVFLVYMLGKLLTKMASMVALGLLNRILGGIFGGLKLMIILAAILIFIDRSNTVLGFVDENTIDTSVLYNPVKSTGEKIFGFVLESRNLE